MTWFVLRCQRRVMTKLELAAPVDRCRLRATQRIRSVVLVIESDQGHPRVRDPCIPPGRNMSSSLKPAGVQLAHPHPTPSYRSMPAPSRVCVPSARTGPANGFRAATGLPATGPVRMDDIHRSESHQIAGVQLAIDHEIEPHDVPEPIQDLQSAA